MPPNENAGLGETLVVLELALQGKLFRGLVRFWRVESEFFDNKRLS